MKITKKELVYVKHIVVIILFILFGIVYFETKQSEELAKQKSTFDTFSNENAENSVGLENSEDFFTKETETEDKSDIIYVYICGQVLEPGVKECSEGTRLYELIEYAGGMTENAAPEMLNLADVLKDGEKVYVPAIGEYTDSAAAQNSSGAGGADNDGKININNATVQELMTLPGIGESRAQDIITYREQNGPFQSIEDIKKVSGIKDAAYNKMKELITI